MTPYLKQKARKELGMNWREKLVCSIARLLSVKIFIASFDRYIDIGNYSFPAYPGREHGLRISYVWTELYDGMWVYDPLP